MSRKAAAGYPGTGRAVTTHLHEKNESLWTLTFSPLIWAAHFLASYAFAAVWCARVVGRDGSLWGARLAIAVFSAAALAGIAVIGLGGLRRQRHGGASPPHGGDTPEDRHRLLGAATLLLSALSAVGVAYAALAIPFLETCN